MTGTRTGMRGGIRVPTVPALGALVILFYGALALAAEVRTFSKGAGLPSNWVTALAPAPDGKLWVGTGNAGVFLLDTGSGKGKGWTAADGLPADEVTSIALFQGKVYVGTAEGIGIFDGKNWESVRKAQNVTLRNVRLAASPDGKHLWACAVYLAGGIVRFDGKDWKFMGGEGRGLFNDIEGFAFPEGGVLMGGGSGLPYLHKGSDVLPLREGFPNTNVFAVAVWKGNMVAGTAAGLFVYEKKWAPLALPSEVAGKPVFALSVRDDRMAVGTSGGMAILGRWSGTPLLTTGNGLPGGRVKAVAIDEKYVAAGTASGLAIVREK